MSEDATEDVSAVEADERWQQIPDEDALIQRGANTLDEGYVPPDRWSPAQRYGSTGEEMRAGETIEMRLAQEEPEPDPGDEFGAGADADDEADGDDERQVGRYRAGRLVAPNAGVGEDVESDEFAFDVGISGGAASAEEAAMHILDD